jgi:hypothetical protein
MPKEVFIYEKLSGANPLVAVKSVVQLSELTGIPYRTMQRKMRGDTYYDPGGKFKVMRLTVISDGRKNNRNPNL